MMAEDDILAAWKRSGVSKPTGQLIGSSRDHLDHLSAPLSLEAKARDGCRDYRYNLSAQLLRGRQHPSGLVHGES